MNGIVDPDGLAAEYVLGTLDPDEHAQARGLVAADAAFAAKVDAWERRLGELYLMVEPAEPHGGIWQRIKAKLPQVPQQARVEPAAPASAEPEPGSTPEVPAPGPVIPPEAAAAAPAAESPVASAADFFPEAPAPHT